MPDEHDEQLARTLNNEEREAARRILDDVRAEIERVSKDDADETFRIRRYVHARLQLEERGVRQQRERLRRRLFDRQQGRCGYCGERLEQLSGTHVHRKGTGGYAEEITVLVHPKCHEELGEC